MEEFAQRKVGPVHLCKKLNIKADFPGCYVLIENGKPLYVGISRRVINRLQQHVKGKTHFDASLAYLMAHRAMPGEGARAARMGQDKFRRLFDEKRAYLAGLHCASVPIENALVRYVFETFCAVHFNTFEWNTFETH